MKNAAIFFIKTIKSNHPLTEKKNDQNPANPNRGYETIYLYRALQQRINKKKLE